MANEAVEFICPPEKRGEIPEPEASSNVLPQWYKMLETHFENSGSGFQEPTVRKCPAFLDALSLGWMLKFESDVKIITERRDGVDFESPHVTEYEFDGELPEHAVGAMEVETSWAAKLPEGYSLLVMQPLNRREQRYRVVPRIIDGDKNLQTISAPIIWYADNCRTYIREEEPLFQVFPINRETMLTHAHTRPFEQAGAESYGMTHRHSKVSQSWYTQTKWTPKGTRVE